MSWISSVGQTQRKDRFLPSQSFLSSEVGDKSEISQPVLYHFRWWCPDEKSVARLRVWFLLFPMWPRRSREKESWTTQTARYLCVLSLASCVSGAFWAEWNRERLKCCFICSCICMDWWYVSCCLIIMTHCLTVGKVMVVAVCPWYDLCSSWWIKKSRELQPPCAPQSPTPIDSFLPATPPTSEVPPLPKQCHKLGDISNPNLQTAMVKGAVKKECGGVDVAVVCATLRQREHTEFRQPRPPSQQVLLWVRSNEKLCSPVP